MSVNIKLILLGGIALCAGLLPDTVEAGRKYHYYSRNPNAYRSYTPRTYLRKQSNYRPATYSYHQHDNHGKRKYSYSVREYMKKQNRYDKATTMYGYGAPYGYPFGFSGFPFYHPGFWRGYWGSYYGAPYRFYYNRPRYHPYGGGYYYHSRYRPWYLHSPGTQSDDTLRRRLRTGQYDTGAATYPINPDLLPDVPPPETAGIGLR